jgi:hypothetical protein
LLRGLPEAWLRADEGPDTFSPFEVVGHLVHGERTDWIERAERIAEHGTSLAFEPFDRFAQRGAESGLRAPRRKSCWTSSRACAARTSSAWPSSTPRPTAWPGAACTRPWARSR